MAGIPASQQDAYKKDVGELVVNEILRSVNSGDSPVEGRGSFKKLSKEYAKAEKGGNTTPNLELDGDMLDALEFEVTDSGIEVGIFDSSEVPKADGHNNFSGKSKLPTRRFIPKGREKFDESIQSKIKEIAADYKVDTPRVSADLLRSLTATTTSAEATSVTIDDLFSEDAIAALLAEL